MPNAEVMGRASAACEGPARSAASTAVLGDDFGGNMELQKLKALAEEVKQWSNCNQAWLDQSEDDPAAVVGHINEDGYTYPVATIDCDQYYVAQDSIKLARFYAAANPETVLRLIAMIESPNAALTGAAHKD